MHSLENSLWSDVCCSAFYISTIKEQREVKEQRSVSARDEEASLCLKPAPRRSVRSSTNPIPLTISNLFRWARYRGYKYQIQRAESPAADLRSADQLISSGDIVVCFCSDRWNWISGSLGWTPSQPVTNVGVPKLFQTDKSTGGDAARQRGRWLQTATVRFPPNQLHFCFRSSSGLCSGSRRGAV